MKIGILQTGHAPENMLEMTGDYAEIFHALLSDYNFDFVDYSVVDNVFPESVSAADGWLITGSKHGAYEDHSWIPPLEDFIREITKQNLPLIGVCFGHQIIAQALGGKVEKFEGGWSVGRTTYKVGDSTLALNAWHQDQVTELPDGARVLGSSDFCKNAILGYGDTVWTIQPHPEFSNAFIEGLINTRGRGVVPDDLLDQATTLLNEPNDNERIADQMARFFLNGRKS